jgi:hypothetical protein
VRPGSQRGAAFVYLFNRAMQPQRRRDNKVEPQGHHMKRNTSKTKAKNEHGGLHLKRETIRRLNATESAQVLGGMRCTLNSCNLNTCPGSVCTISEDPTL